MTCEKAPAGWRCTRASGHDGPCAVVKMGESMREWRVEIIACNNFVGGVATDVTAHLNALEEAGWQVALVTPNGVDRWTVFVCREKQ